MKKYLLALGILLLIHNCQNFVCAQSAEQERKEHEQRIRDQILKANTEIITGKPPGTATNRNDNPSITGPTVPIIAPRRIPRPSKKEAEEIKREQAEAKAEIEAARAPHAEDLDKFKDFLQQKKTGLIRLFPDIGCDSKYLVQVGGDCEKTLPDSYSYSFQKQLYSDGVFHDIRLHEDRFWLDGFLSQSLITDLGDTPLERVSLQHNYAEFIINFKPATTSLEARKQFWEVGRKLQNNGFTYGKVVKLTPATTYLARIINYRLDDDVKAGFKARRAAAREETPFFIAAFDIKRADTIVAFRVIRIDKDNSISILWKELAEKKSPTLQFAKGEQWTDLKIE
jgi:hypothetical protein